MKIVQLTPAYTPHIGGVETHVEAISHEFRLQGHQVTVLTLQSSLSDELDEVINGVRILRCSAGPAVSHSLRYKLKVWRWIWQQRHVLNQADVIQTHDVFWWLFPFVIIWEDKLFTTFHGWETEFPVRLAAKMQRALWSFLSVGTIHIGAWIQRFYFDKPTQISYGGVKLPPKTDMAQNIPKQLSHIVFLGRLSPDTEVEKYFQLFKTLKKKHPSLKITWVGDGPLRKKCSTIGTVTGFVNDPEKYIRKADGVAASSYLAMWSAAAHKKLILSFYSSYLKQCYLESFPAAKSILIAADPVTMENSIQHLFEKPAILKELISGSYKQAALHTWKTVADDYLLLWKTAGINIHEEN